MTRDNEIANAASEAMTETLMSCPMYEFSSKATDLLECAYIKGAEWADKHPADWLDWFSDAFCLTKPMAIIHFTKFRY
ncbi:MAG: hypothetical protein HXN76_01725 [Prevotella pallens]|uniref:hypothetical protein n=1 Tax=Prevotella pallens TaxID=60133 RepID=UPI001CB3D686|nr:hypothetical protein [Prevotella pallens]MBF1491428.1 hypothetical protein [Prevotella pallens]